MLFSLLPGGFNVSSNQLTNASRGRSGEAVFVSSRRASRLALLRACRAPLVVCATDDRSHWHERREVVARAFSPPRPGKLNTSSSFIHIDKPARVTGCSSSAKLSFVLYVTFIYKMVCKLCVALAKLAKLWHEERWKDDFRTQRLVVRAGDRLGDNGERLFANSAWACSKLDVAPAWLPQWAKLPTLELGTMTSQELLSLLKKQPLLHHEQVLFNYIQKSGVNAQGLVNSLYSEYSVRSNGSGCCPTI